MPLVFIISQIRQFKQEERQSTGHPPCAFLFFHIFHDVLYAAGEDFAEHFDRVRADALIALHTRDLSGAHAIAFDQRILCDFLFLHGFP